MKMFVRRGLIAFALALAVVAIFHHEIFALAAQPFLSALMAQRPHGVGEIIFCGYAFSPMSSPVTYWTALLIAYPLVVISPGVSSGGWPYSQYWTRLVIGVGPFAAAAGLTYAAMYVAVLFALPELQSVLGFRIFWGSLRFTADHLAAVSLLAMLVVGGSVQFAANKAFAHGRRVRA